jgi:hypothetical protein
MHQFWSHTGRVECFPADPIFRIAITGRPGLFIRLPRDTSFGELRVLIAEHFGDIEPRHIRLRVGDSPIPDSEQIDRYRDAIVAERATTEKFRLLDNEGCERFISVRIGANATEFEEAVRQSLPEPRMFTLTCGGRRLNQLPPSDRKPVIRLQFLDVRLDFEPAGKAPRFVDRHIHLSALRHHFDRAVECVTFSVDNCPLPLGLLAGSVDARAHIVVKTLPQTFTVGKQPFPLYTRAGDVRKRLRANPRDRILLSDERGILPNSALLIGAPTVTPFSADVPHFSVSLDGDVHRKRIFDAEAVVRDVQGDVVDSDVVDSEHLHSDRVLVFFGGTLLGPDNYLVELCGPNHDLELTVRFKEFCPLPNTVQVLRRDGGLSFRECLDPTTLRVSDVAHPPVAVDGRLFDPGKSLADVGWTSFSLIVELPEIDRRGIVAKPVPKRRIAKNRLQCLQQAEPFPIKAANVRDARLEIATHAKSNRSNDFLLFLKGRLLGNDEKLDPDVEIEYINVRDADAWALRAFNRIADDLPNEPHDDFMGKFKDCDRDPEQFLRKYPEYKRLLSLRH